MNRNFTFKQMLFSVKRHAALPCLVAALTLIITIGASIIAGKNNVYMQVEHITGDSSVLNGIQISGKIIDGYHKTSFSWEGSKVTNKTTIHPSVEMVTFYRYINGDIKQRIQDLAFSVSGSPYQREFLITKEKLKGYKNLQRDEALVDIPIRADSYDSTFANPLEYGVATIGDDVFFTLATSKLYTGSNGIYKLGFKSTMPYMQDYPESEQLVSFDLKPQGAALEKGINVLGLEAVNDKLILILEQNNELHLRVFNAYGKQLGKTIVPHFNLMDPNDASSSEHKYNQLYEAFRNKEEQQLILAFSSDHSIASKTYITLDLSQGATIVDKTTFSNTTEKMQEDYALYTGKRHAAFIKGKLYYVAEIKEIIAPEMRHIDQRQISHLLVYVYEKNKLVYEGELMTNINDDRIMWKNFNQSSFSIDEREHRSFQSLNLRRQTND